MTKGSHQKKSVTIPKCLLPCVESVLLRPVRVLESTSVFLCSALSLLTIYIYWPSEIRKKGELKLVQIMVAKVQETRRGMKVENDVDLQERVTQGS